MEKQTFAACVVKNIVHCADPLVAASVGRTTRAMYDFIVVGGMFSALHMPIHHLRALMNLLSSRTCRCMLSIASSEFEKATLSVAARGWAYTG
jgi:hypothetical protein